jgi:hypothetical protein
VVEDATGVMEDLARAEAVPCQFLAGSFDLVATRCSPRAEPGACSVTDLPKMTDVGEPGGVTCTTRKESSGATSASSLQPSPV